MKHLLPAILLVATLATAFAKPVFLELGGGSGNNPAAFGFHVVRATEGDSVILTVTLGIAASKAFQRAEIFVLGDRNMDTKKDQRPKLKVSATDNGLKLLTITAPAATQADYALRVESGAFPGQALPENFAGFTFPLAGPP